MAFPGLSSLPDDPLAALPNDPGAPPALKVKGKGLEALPDDPFSKLPDDPAAVAPAGTIPPGTAPSSDNYGVRLTSALGGGSRPATPPLALQKQIDNDKAARKAFEDRLVAQGMPREQAETYEVGTASGVSPERWKEVQAEDEARKKSPSLRALAEVARVVGGIVPKAGQSIVNAVRGGAGALGQALEGMTSEVGPNVEGNPISRFGRSLREEAASGALAGLMNDKATAELITPKTALGRVIQTIPAAAIEFAAPTKAIKSGAAAMGLVSGLHSANIANETLAPDDPNRGAKMAAATVIGGGGGVVAGKLVPDTMPLSRAFRGAPWQVGATSEVRTQIGKWLLESTSKALGGATALTAAGEAERGVTGGKPVDLGDSFLQNLATITGFTIAHGAAQFRQGAKSFKTNGDGTFSFKAEAKDPQSGEPVHTWVTAKVDPDGIVKVAVPIGDGTSIWVKTAKLNAPETKGEPTKPQAGALPDGPTPEAPSAQKPVPEPQPVTAGPESPAAPVGRGPVAVADQAPGAPAEPVAGSAPAPAAGAGRPAGPDVEILAQQVQELQGLSDHLEARAKEHPHVEVARAEAEEAAGVLQEAKDRLGYLAPDHPVLAAPAPSPAPAPAGPGQEALTQAVETTDTIQGAADGTLESGSGSGAPTRLPAGRPEGAVPSEPSGDSAGSGRAGSSAIGAASKLLDAIADSSHPLHERLNKITPASTDPITGTGKDKAGVDHTFQIDPDLSSIHLMGEAGLPDASGKPRRVSAWAQVMPDGGIVIRGINNGGFAGLGPDLTRAILSFAKENYKGVTDTSRVFGGVSESGKRARMKVPNAQIEEHGGRTVAVNRLGDFFPKADAKPTEAPKAVKPGETFTHEGREYRMTVTDGGQVKTRDLTLKGGPPIVRSWGSIAEFEKQTGLKVDAGVGKAEPKPVAEPNTRPEITKGARALAERIAEKVGKRARPGESLLNLAQPRLVKAEPVPMKGTRVGPLVDGEVQRKDIKPWDAVHPMALKKYEAAMESKDSGLLTQYLHPNNLGLRAKFEADTGVSLKGLGMKATRAAIEAHFPVESTEVAEKTPKTDTLSKKETPDARATGGVESGGSKAGAPGRSKARPAAEDVPGGEPAPVPAGRAEAVHADLPAAPKGPGAGPDGGPGAGDGADVRPSGSGTGKPAPGVEAVPADQGGNHREAPKDEQPEAPRNSRNHRIEKQEDITPFDLSSEAQSKKAARANIEALKLLKKLEAEGRKATPEEQKVLAKYVGWGATTLSKMVDWSRGNKALEATRLKESLEALKAEKGNNAAYPSEVIDQVRDVLGWSSANRMGYSYGRPLVSDLISQANGILDGTSITHGTGQVDQAWLKDFFPTYRELSDILTPDEMKAAWNSTLNAHYTSVPVVKGMWEMVKRLGVKGGAILEPSAGIGNFLGLLPKDILPKAVLQAVELDKMTGAFLKHLYPDAKVHIKGFQDARIAPNTQDLVITNVPFGDLSISDDAHPEWGSPSIHNYFFLKGMEKLKPGGLMVAITSHFTLDSQGAAHRKAMAAMGDLVGAIRLPRTAFKANAGTEVVTDILILRKKAGDGFRGEPFQAALPTSMGLNRAGEEVVVPVNEYFKAHPEMVLGEWGVGSMRGNEELTVNPRGDLAEEMAKATQGLPRDIASKFVVQGHNENEIHKDDEDPQAEGHLFVKGGQPMVIEDGKAVLHPWVAEAVQKWPDKPARAQERAKVVVNYTALRDEALAQVARMMSENATEAELAAGRKALNKAYDAFTLRGPKGGFVPVNDPSNAAVFGDESSWARVCALENQIDQENGRPDYVKADIFTKRTIEPFKEPTKADSIPDAVEISMNMRGGLDLDYMGTLLGRDAEAVKAELASQDLAFDNPTTGIWEPAFMYLGGEVRKKLREAQEAAKDNEAFQRHVKALEAVQPEWMQLGRITAQPGATWLPAKAVAGLVKYATGLNVTGLRKDPVSGRWALDDASMHSRATWEELGVPEGLQPWKFAEAVLLNKPLTIKWKDDEGVTHVDAVRTQQAQEAKSKAVERWHEGFYKLSEEGRALVEDAFNNEVNNSVPINYPEPKGDRFPGMATEWGGRPLKLESYQKIGVSRALKHSVMLGHAVGSGKTITLIATAMEQRRLGFAKRPMISVLNSTVKQFVNAAYQLYPNAKILAPGKSERSAKDRAKLYARIATGDWDMVIIPQSFYEMIPVSGDRVKAWIDDQVQEINDAITEAKGDKFRVKDLERLRDSIQSQGEKMMAATNEAGEDEGGAPAPTFLHSDKKKAKTSKEGAKKAAKTTDRLGDLTSRKSDRFATFEDLGIDALLVDEAHGFKNGFFMTSLSNVKGLNPSASSKRAVGMLLKARSIQEKTAGRNITMATGTPITNTMSEAWVMMNYVRPDLLEEGGVSKFDEFISTYGDISSDTEYSASGKFEAVERLREFVNLQQLGKLWNQAVHVVPQRMILRDKLPKTLSRTVMVKPTAAQEEESAWWRGLMDEWKTWSREDKQKVPVGLLYSQISKFLSLDMRTIKRGLDLSEAGGKVPAMVQEAMKLYKQYDKDKAAQAIFCDVKNAWKAEGDVWSGLGRTGGEPGFNVFKEVKFQLIKAGVPESEIVIVDDIPDKDEVRAEVFDKVNRGEVRFIIGSTQRLGTGVNIQQRLIAMHNLDIPGRPCDNTQRLGRGERAGNMFEEIHWLTYGVEKTLDALMAQRNLNKTKFIQQIMEGLFEGDKAEDIGTESTFSWAEIRGALSGDPRVMRYGELQGQIQKMESKRNAWEQGRGDARVKLAQAKREVERFTAEAEALSKFVEKVPALQEELKGLAEELKKDKDASDPLEDWAAKVDEQVQTKKVSSSIGYENRDFTTKLSNGVTLVRRASADWNLQDRPNGGATLKIQVSLNGTGLPESVTPRSGTSSPRLQFALESMARAITSSQEHAEIRQKWIREAQEAMPVLESKTGTFPDQEKLNGLRQEASELEAAINESAEAEKKAREEAKKVGGGEDQTGEMAAFSHPLAALLGNLFGSRQRPDSVSVPSAFEEVERRWREAKKGAEPTPMLTKAIESLRRAKAAFTRHFDHIDPNESPLMARVHDILRQYEAGPAFARAAAHDMVYEVTKGLGPKRIDLFTRILVLRDIIRNVDHGVDAQDVELPFGYANVKEATFDLERFEKVLNEPGNEAVSQALQKRHDQAKAIVQTLVNHGLLDPDTLHNVGSYYHRQVMTYLNKRNVGSTGSDVRLKRKGFQMARHGGANDFNAAYEQAEAEWVADAMSLIVKKESLDRLEAVADLAPKLRAQADGMNLDAYVERNPGLSAKELDGLKPSEIAKALGEDAVEWRTLVPEDYILWQPAKGNHFYPALTISERLLDQFLEGDADLSKEDFKSVLAVGGKKKQWAIPQNLATQLDNFVDRDSSEFGRFWVGLQSTWKQWQLISPMRIGRYSLNNMMGDLDIAVAYDPRIVSRHFGKAASEMWSYQVTHKASPELVKEIQDAIRRGVVESGITIAEIPDIDKAGAFRLLTSERPNGNAVQKVWGGLKTFSTWRENVLRLAAYRFFQEELAKGRNLYAASNRAQVDALSNQKDKAAKLARELIGDYGNVSVAGQYIRTHMIPFYSWMEVNAPRYVRLLKNLPHEGEPKPGAGGEQRTRIGMAGRTLAVKAPSLLLRMAVVFGLIYLFNQLFFKDEYEELRRQKGFRNGMILGRREDGSIRYIRMDLAITDALDWLSASDLGRKVAGVNQGKETWGDIAADAAKGPAEKVIKGWEPFSKTLFELVLGRSISYPSVWREGASMKPGGMAIRDKVGYVLKNVTPLDRLWNKVTNKPARPASMKDGAVDALLAYSVDPGEASYFLSRDIANEWMKKNLKREEFSGTANITEKGNALYYFKRASQWGDKERAAYWLGEFYSLGGKPKDIRESIKRGHPLGSVPPARRPQFMRSLNEKDREVIADAIAWYQRLNPEARSIMAGPAKNTGTQLTEK